MAVDRKASQKQAEASTITLLPAQIHSLLVISKVTGGRGALGISQDGSVIEVRTAHETYHINARGEPA